MRKLVLTLCMAFLFACQSRNEQTLKIFAAASLSTALNQVGDDFEKQYPGSKVGFNFAASSTCAKQIEQGAQADLFISANPSWMDFLDNKKLLKSGSRFNLLSNKLVCIVPKGSFIPDTINQLTDFPIEKIAIGDWTHVPVGIYAKEAFGKAALWKILEDRLLPAGDVRVALTYVERKLADCGIVYISDAKASQKIDIAFVLPDSLQPEILYPVAVLQTAQDPFVERFVEFLCSDGAAQIFEKNGFTFIPREGSD